MKRSTTTCLRKVVRVFAALIATTLLLPLLVASPAAANVTPNIGTTFDEASLYTPSESAVALPSRPLLLTLTVTSTPLRPYGYLNHLFIHDSSV